MDEEKALLEAILFLEVEPIELRTLASVSGLSRDQVEDYARRKNLSPEQVEKLLNVNLNYR